MIEKASKFVLHHMLVAEATASLSNAQRLKVGALAVRERQILSYGYNGTLPGESNLCEGSNADGSTYTLDSVLHAEENLIIKMATSNERLDGSTIFLTHAPCMKCARMLAAASITELIYKNVYRDPSGLALLSKRGVRVRQLNNDTLIDTKYE